MQPRESVARFIENQLHWDYECSRYKYGKGSYGLQELRELLDFIYEGKPNSDSESLNEPKD